MPVNLRVDLYRECQRCGVKLNPYRFGDCNSRVLGRVTADAIYYEATMFECLQQAIMAYALVLHKRHKYCDFYDFKDTGIRMEATELILPEKSLRRIVKGCLVPLRISQLSEAYCVPSALVKERMEYLCLPYLQDVFDNSLERYLCDRF